MSSFDQKEPAKQNFVLSAFLAGAMAGGLAKTTIAPLDRTKIAFQVSNSKRYSFKSALKFVRQTYHNTGFFSLYRGNSATMARVMPYAAMQFSAYEQYRMRLAVDRNGIRTPFRRFMAGSLAAVTATCFTYPLDTARARLAVYDKSEYRSLADVFRKDYAKGGVLTFYRGLYPTVLGVIPYAGASFFTYETCKLKYKDYMNAEPNSVIRTLFGAFAGFNGQCSSYPLDIVRRRMQTGAIPRNQGLLLSFYYIWMHEGLVGGLYKGLSMNWLKGPIAVGISYSSYDFFKKELHLIDEKLQAWVGQDNT